MGLASYLTALPYTVASQVYHGHQRDATKMVDRRGVEPRSSGCKPDIRPLYEQPMEKVERSTRVELVCLGLETPVITSITPRNGARPETCTPRLSHTKRAPRYLGLTGEWSPVRH